MGGRDDTVFVEGLFGAVRAREGRIRGGFGQRGVLGLLNGLDGLTMGDCEMG